jgi:hypothetical protein
MTIQSADPRRRSEHRFIDSVDLNALRDARTTATEG